MEEVTSAYTPKAQTEPLSSEGVSARELPDRDDIAHVLFDQRQTQHDFDDAAEADSESDAGTLRSICFDDADAIIRLSGAASPREPDNLRQAARNVASAGRGVLAALDRYNEENGTHLGGAPMFRLGRAIAEVDAAVSRPSPSEGREALSADDDRRDAERFRALMRCPRIKMQGSAGFDPLTGERAYPNQPGGVHFGAEFWPLPARDPATGLVKVYADCDVDRTRWGHHALRALADDILAVEAATLKQAGGDQ